MITDEFFMNRAIELARSGLGTVRPNPCVGCVIVAGNVIIGEGWHQVYGGAHAEVNAVRTVSDTALLRQATVYVNLEPCAHHGKTPPCADMLIAHQVKKVVIANTDSNPLVCGKGIARLRAAGIEVVTGVLEREGRILNKRFFTFMEEKRPYVILKWAQTADRFIARSDYSSKWISNDQSRQLSHRWRSEEAAVLVGTSTVLHDDPALTVRDWAGENPLRIVVDRHRRLPADRLVFRDGGRTLVYTLGKSEDAGAVSYIQLHEGNFVPALLEDLYQRKIQSVMIEGGAATLGYFIASQCWDEARIFTSANSFGEGIHAPELRGELISRNVIGTDLLELFTPWKK